ncbi:MAG: hypothetical protein I3J02_09420 [Prevotella sp.]|nr:hypothetical protein [Prevotella sp.]
MATKWSSNTMTVNDVTVTFSATSTPQTGYVKMVKGGTLTISSAKKVRRITITYYTDTTKTYAPVLTNAITVDSSATCVFKPQATSSTTTWWGAKTSVVITDDATNGNDLRIASIVVTTNNDMQIYKVLQQNTVPDGITHAANSTNNATSVGITYGTGFGKDSIDSKVQPINTNTANAGVFNAMGYIWQTNSQTAPNVTMGSQNIMPRTGAYYILEPTQNGEITLYMNHFHLTSIYVLEDGNVYKKYTSTDASNNLRTWFTFNVRAGYRYYLYSTEITGWACPLFGFEFIPRTTANNFYSVANGEAIYNRKIVRSVDDITMTYGGWLSEANSRQSDVLANNANTYSSTYANASVTDTWTSGAAISPADAHSDYNTQFPYYTAGNGQDPTNEATVPYSTTDSYYKVPSHGTFYKFEPKKNGRLLVCVIQETKPLYMVDENGSAQTAEETGLNNEYPGVFTIGSDKSYTPSAKGAYGYWFDVYAGRTYFLFAKGSKLGFRGFYFSPASTTATDLTIAYGDGTEKFADYANVTFTRTLTRNRWNSLVLPFSMNEAQVRQTFGEGTTILQFDDVANNTIKFKRHYYQYIIAGQPCFIFPTNNWDAPADSSDHSTVASFTMKGVSVRSDNAALKTYDSKTITGYTMKGLYAASTTVPGVSYWLVANNTIGRRTTSYTVTGNFMAYIQGPSDVNAAKALTFGMSSFTDDLEPDATGIQDIQVEQNRTTSSHNVYNLQGLMVKANATDLSGLDAGIYIVNGKKYMVK